MPSSMFISYICVNCPYWERALILEWLREGAPGEEMWVVCNPYIGEKYWSAEDSHLMSFIGNSIQCHEAAE